MHYNPCMPCTICLQLKADISINQSDLVHTIARLGVNIVLPSLTILMMLESWHGESIRALQPLWTLMGT